MRSATTSLDVDAEYPAAGFNGLDGDVDDAETPVGAEVVELAAAEGEDEGEEEVDGAAVVGGDDVAVSADAIPGASPTVSATTAVRATRP